MECMAVHVADKQSLFMNHESCSANETVGAGCALGCWLAPFRLCWQATLARLRVVAEWRATPTATGWRRAGAGRGALKPQTLPNREAKSNSYGLFVHRSVCGVLNCCGTVLRILGVTR
jgi:hypothetical protein